MEIKINGMVCNSCAEKIEEALGKVKGVESAKADFVKGSAIVRGNANEKEIKQAIERAGYNSVNSSDKERKINSNAFLPIALSAVMTLVVLYYLFGSSLNFKLSEIKLPDIGEKTSLLLLFAAGLLTGFHCVGMCGGFVVSYTTKNALNGHKSLGQHLVYGGSKVMSYTIIGGIFGLIGGVFAFSSTLRGAIAILAGVFMIFYALSMLGINFFRRFQFNPVFLTKLVQKTPEGPYSGPLYTGLLNGLFIACGPLQAMYLYAAGTGSFINGAASLAAFGLGTIPVMIGFGSIASAISHKTTRKILKISAILVLILGLIMINRGLTLTGSTFTFNSIKSGIIGGTAASSSGNAAVLNNGSQEIRMDVDASGYKPDSFVLKKGVPVKWIINAKELTGCNKEIIVPSYNLQIKLKQGENIVEFTPDKAGTVSWSCWMGMIPGSFIVTDTGNATQQEIKSAAPNSGGGMCGGGGSCGCGMT